MQVSQLPTVATRSSNIDHVPASAVSADAGTVLLAFLVLASGLALGGGRGALGDSLTQVLALGLLAWLVWHREYVSPVRSARRWFWIAIGAVVAVPLLQSLPLPAAIATAGSFRDHIVTQAGLAPASALWRWSLDAQAGERALWSLLPALAVFAATWRMSAQQQRLLLLVVLAIAVVNVLLGLAQRAEGADSDLRFYTPTNEQDAVGLFANRNHFAGMLVQCLPFAIGAAVWTAQRSSQGRGSEASRWLQVASWMGLSLLLILGVALSRSRAGMLLGFLAMLMLLPALYGLRGRGRARRVLFWIVAAGGLLVVQFALIGMLQRLQSDPLDDGRWVYARVSAAAASDSAPLGSGLGTFTEVYPQYEAQLGTGPGYAIVNHAHNDFVELWLEAGWPFAICLVVFAIAFARMGLKVWAADIAAQPGDLLMRRLASLACLLMLAHSLFDYPLRTTAMSLVFALMLGIVAAKDREPQPVR